MWIMWDWIKRWFIMGTRQPSTLEQMVLRQQALQEEVVRRQLTAIEQLQHTLDRVVGLHYDRPMERHVPPPSAPQMPEFALSDQGDVRPRGEDVRPADVVDEVGRALARIDADSDAEFLGEQQ
jgi:hypothetical protein